jgi:hypothetical protein
MDRFRLPQFEERPRAEAEFSSNLEPFELPRSLWLDARPHSDVAHAFARRIHEAAAMPLLTLEVGRIRSVFQGVEVDTHAELHERVRRQLGREASTTWLLLGEAAGVLFSPSCVVQLGPPRLFSDPPAGARLIRLRHERPEVAEALARSFSLLDLGG